MDLNKLGIRARVLGVVGLLAFIDSFLPWYTVSAKSAFPGALQYSNSGNAWNVGIGGWFPLLVLLGLGVVAVLPAFGRSFEIRGGYAAVGVLALVATVIILLRWLTYPSVGAGAGGFIDAGADFGTYLGVVLGLVAVGVAYLAFTAEGGKLNTIADSFKVPASAPGAVPPPQHREDGQA